MSFMENLMTTINGDEFNKAVTENGAIGYRTTGKALLDMNFMVSSMRNMDPFQIVDMWDKAFYEDQKMALLWLFFAADIRGGMGERRLFRIILHHLASKYPETVEAILKFVPEYSRWDNVLCLLGTKNGHDVIMMIINQLDEDMENMKQHKPISLLAKWLPSVNTSNNESRKMGRCLCKKMGITERMYRKMLSKMRSYLDVCEVKTCGNQWRSINYQSVPSKANVKYNNAFLKHDTERRKRYLEQVSDGKAKINASVLYPYDIAARYRQFAGPDKTLELLWENLPNYDIDSTLVVADGSGSMLTKISGNTTALDVANSLAIYFGEHNKGEFKNKYITFSMNPQLVELKEGTSLYAKLCYARRHNEVANTNIEAVFDLILSTGLKYGIEDIPKQVMIISDMEFDGCVSVNGGNDWDIKAPSKHLFREIEQKYERVGAKLPKIVFWNVASRTGTIPMKENELGVALVSGFSPSIAKLVMSNERDPYKILVETLNSDRYKPIAAVLDSIYK